MPLARLLHDSGGFGSVGFVRCRDVHGQERALAVNGHVARAALDLLAAVEAARLAFSGAFDALAAEDGMAGRAASAAKLLQNPSATHAWKRSCAVELAQSPVALSAFRWQPVLSTKKMATAHTWSSTRGCPPPRKGGFLCTGKSDSIKAQSSSVNPKQPPVLSMRLAWGRRLTFFLAGQVFTHLHRISPRHYPNRHLECSAGTRNYCRGGSEQQLASEHCRHRPATPRCPFRVQCRPITRKRSLLPGFAAGCRDRCASDVQGRRPLVPEAVLSAWNTRIAWLLVAVAGNPLPSSPT